MIKPEIIVALDFPSTSEAKQMVEILGDSIDFYKVGLELMMGGEYFELIKWLKNKNKKVFADLKLYDIPQTVGKSVRNLSKYEIDLLTIHAANNEIMQEAANNKGNIKIIGVTVLTCLDEVDLKNMLFDPSLTIEEIVCKKTALCIDSGLDGVVSSANEANYLRKNLGGNFIITTPGIRLRNLNDDQKRVCDARQALKNGSTYLVVGRPITKSDQPLKSAEEFNNILKINESEQVNR